MSQILKEKNILVTGGAGFIGCALSHRLAGENHCLLAVDSLLSQVHPTKKRPKELNPSAELVIADICEKLTWSELFKDFRPDIIVHLAAETATGQSLTEASKHARSNVLGLTVLLDALSTHEILPKQIILTSSRAVYGEGAWQTIEGEIFYPGQRSNTQLACGQWDFNGVPLPALAGKTKENPTSVYGATKLAQENILKSWAFSFGVPLSILRLQNVYGPGQSPFNPYTGIVILFSRLAKYNQIIELYEDGLVTRDFVFIDDVIEALMQSIMNIPKNGYRQLDIGSGVTTTLIELAKMITDFHAGSPAVLSGKYRNGDVRHASCDISKANEELLWMPKWKLLDGISELQKYLSDNNLEELENVVTFTP